MSFASEIEKVLLAMRLEATTLTDAQLGAAALVRSGSELLRHCPDESDGGHSFRALLRWVQVVDPTAAVREARRVVDGAHPAKDPLWLASLNFDAKFSRAFPPSLVVAGLLAMIPPGHSHVDAAWSYIQLASTYSGVSLDQLEMLRGWMAGTASESVGEDVGVLLAELASANATCAAVVASLREHARESVPEAPSQGAPPFHEARQLVVAQLDVVLRHANTLNLDRSGLLLLRDFAVRDFFRIAVLGEFKRGKSTLVNALVEMPDLMPADFLPCTSALTEIRYDARRHVTKYDAHTQTYEAREESEFRGDVSQAASTTSEEAGAEASARAVPRWRVFLPSSFLREDFVELIDSPGLGEDYARDFIAKEEALRADAAILVFNVTQPAGQRELDLVKHMQSKLGNLIIALNQADRAPEPQWPRLLAHVRGRLDERRLPMPPERIVFVSALNAENAMREGRLADPWVERVRDLRRVVREHLMLRRGPLKAAYLAARIVDVAARGLAAVESTVLHRRQQLAKLDRLVDDHKRAKQAHDLAVAAIARASTKLAHHEDLRDPLVSAFNAALPAMLGSIEAGSDAWTSEDNPLFSPKAHVNAVGEKAIQDVRRTLEEWFKGPGNVVLEEALGTKLDRAALDVADLAEYLRMVRGGSSVDQDGFFEDLKERTLRDAYEDAAREASDVGALGRSVVVAIVALVVGYIVADVVLFYVLSAIASFVALPLLIAAVVVGGMLGLAKGDDLARAWVRSTVFEKISEQFQKDESRRKLREGIDRAMRDVCQRIAQSFRLSCNQLLDEARVQEERVYQELTAFAKTAGDRQALEVELARIDAAANETRTAYAALEEVARRIHRGAEA